MRYSETSSCGCRSRLKVSRWNSQLQVWWTQDLKPRKLHKVSFQISDDIKPVWEHRTGQFRRYFQNRIPATSKAEVIIQPWWAALSKGISPIMIIMQTCTPRCHINHANHQCIPVKAVVDQNSAKLIQQWWRWPMSPNAKVSKLQDAGPNHKTWIEMRERKANIQTSWTKTNSNWRSTFQTELRQICCSEMYRVKSFRNKSTWIQHISQVENFQM